MSRAASPDGQYLSLPIKGPNNIDLGVLDVRTGTVRNVTESWPDASRGAVEASSISPGNKLVAYAWNSEARETNKYDLRVIPVTGGSPRTLVSAVSWLAPFAWTPDAKSVLLVTSAADGLPAQRDAVEIVNVNSGSRRMLFRFGFPYGGYPSLSPDGRTLVMQQLRSGNFLKREIHFCDIETGVRTVYRHLGDDRDPVWLRNGNSFVFQSVSENKSGLWWQAFKSGQPFGPARLLIEGFDEDLMNTSTRDGSLYFLFNRGRSGVFESGFNSSTGKVAGQSRRLTEQVPGECLAPSWSPDGKSVALISVGRLTGLPQRGKLVILTGKQTVIHDLQFGVARGTGPTWSVDGRSLFLPGTDLSSTPDTIEQLYRVDVITGQSVAVPIPQIVNTKLRVGRSFPVLTKDNRLAYVSRSGHLFRVEVATGQREEKDIFQWSEPEILYSLALSPDGRQLAFGLPGRNSRPRLAMMPANGGNPEISYHGPELNLALGISWEPDGRHLLAVSGDELMRYSFEEKRPLSTGLKVPGLSLPSLDPSASRVLYQVSLPRIELWALDLKHLLSGIRQ